jgi:hypothetical protein
MCPDDESSDEQLGEKMSEHHIEFTLTDLEWEIINQALNAPIRTHLFKEVKDQGYTNSETEIEATWEELTERWSETW